MSENKKVSQLTLVQNPNGSELIYIATPDGAGGYVDRAVLLNAVGFSRVMEEATETKEIALEDVGDYLKCTHANGCTITIPELAWEPNSEVYGVSTEAVTAFAVTGNTTLVGIEGFTLEIEQGAVWTLKYEGSNVWRLIGLQTEPA